MHHDPDIGLDPKLITPHVMRHTAITALVKAGVDLPTIQRISGHKTLAMVLRYTRPRRAHRPSYSVQKSMIGALEVAQNSAVKTNRVSD